MRGIPLALGLLALFGTAATARECNDEVIDEVTVSGDLVKTTAGHVYEIAAADAADSALWQGTDPVVICEKGGNAVEIIATEGNAGKVEATRLK